ncbi:MAG TPA: hypothetical protein VN861_14430 [Candidatus Acidoferrales bacterium]|nr:hypothetical protein [Candidatus Acidoferrales bacterium]
MSLPDGISAFSIFLAIAAVGFLFLILSFMFGEIFGHGDVGAHGGDVHGDTHGIGFFNTRVVSVFITAFGGFGAIGVHLGYSTEIATLIGLVGGAVFGAIIYLFASFLFSQQASSGTLVGDLVGLTAEVSVAIPKGGLGQVRCSLGENVIEKLARTADGEGIPANTTVKIESIAGETLLVRRIG